MLVVPPRALLVQKRQYWNYVASVGGRVAAKVKEEDGRLGDILRWKFKVIEKGGRPLRDLLTKSNLFSREPCGRVAC